MTMNPKFTPNDRFGIALGLIVLAVCAAAWEMVYGQAPVGETVLMFATILCLTLPFTILDR